MIAFVGVLEATIATILVPAGPFNGYRYRRCVRDASPKVASQSALIVRDVEDLLSMLTPAGFGKMLHVSLKTITRWARAGRLSAVVTLEDTATRWRSLVLL